MTLRIVELQPRKDPKIEKDPNIEPSLFVESYEVKSRALVQELCLAAYQADYEQAVIQVIMHPSRKPVAVKMIPPEGISPWKEWAASAPHRGRVRWQGRVWEAAPVDAETITLILWGFAK